MHILCTKQLLGREDCPFLHVKGKGQAAPKAKAKAKTKGKDGKKGGKGGGKGYVAIACTAKGAPPGVACYVCNEQGTCQECQTCYSRVCDKLDCWNNDENTCTFCGAIDQPPDMIESASEPETERKTRLVFRGDAESQSAFASESPLNQ